MKPKRIDVFQSDFDRKWYVRRGNDFEHGCFPDRLSAITIARQRHPQLPIYVREARGPAVLWPEEQRA